MFFIHSVSSCFSFYIKCVYMYVSYLLYSYISVLLTNFTFLDIMDIQYVVDCYHLIYRVW